MQIYKILLFIAFLGCFNVLNAQKEITVRDIWKDYTFYANTVPGFNFQNDGKHYTRLEENKIKQYDLTTGDETKTLFDAAAVKNNDDFKGSFDGYTFSADESKILITTYSESIYRRSFLAHYFIWDFKSKTLTTLSKEGKQRDATFSPDATKVAFTRGNNLFYKDLSSGKEIKITSDGKWNAIINGAADWVYEEEFQIAKAFHWSPDSKKIAFLRFDESLVQKFTLQKFHKELYPQNVSYKYPKVSEANSVVTVHIYDLENRETIKVDTKTEGDFYFPRILWTQNPNSLCVFKLNRHQNVLELLLANGKTGNTYPLLKEENPYYLRIHDNLTFFKDKKQFIWTSEQDGFNHIYLYNLKGSIVKQLTKGDYDVTAFYGYDEKRGVIYYQAAETSPLERQVYTVSLDGETKKILCPKKGTNNAQFSSNYDYFINTHSSANTEKSYLVFNNSGSPIRPIEGNAKIAQLQKEYNTQPVEFFSFKPSLNNSRGQASEEVELNGWMIKPPDFDAAQQYPVFMYVYGGPGSQTVKDQFAGRNYWWFQLLAQKGYIIASVDNRGTGARGEAFRKMTYKQLGKFETEDQIAAAKYLGNLPFADSTRIGIFGWSYGGFLSSLCLFKGADTFKAAISVAPVTHWKWYDTVYTERYMQTLSENRDGYHDNAPINHVDKMKGKLLLVHGLADDNVHFQHTVELANALIAADKQFDTYFYPNRTHGISGDNARNHLYTKMTNFILENL